MSVREELERCASTALQFLTKNLLGTAGAGRT